MRLHELIEDPVKDMLATDPNKLVAYVTVDGEFKEVDLTGHFTGDPKIQIKQAEKYLSKFLSDRNLAYSNLEIRFKGMTLRAQQTGRVGEDATGGSTSAGDVSVGPIYKNKPAKQAKNKDGTAKNALDLKVPLMTGGSIKR
jgi:hypothetical protein